jgi:Ser/Thr protein kinase RdoA (MazF antagonist)
MSLMRLSTMWAIHGGLSATDEPGPLARQIAARWEHVEFVQGYRGEHPLDADLLNAVPLFSRLARLHSYTTIMRALDLPDAPDHSGWLRTPRGKLETRAAAYVEALRQTTARDDAP